MAKTYSDEPDALEKGCSEARPLFQESARPSLQPVQPRRRPSSGFCTLVCVVLLISLICSFRKSCDPHHEWDPADKVEYSLAEENVYQCVDSANWTSYYDQPPWTSDYPYGAETTFSLPVKDALYLVSGGPFQHGQLNVEQSSNAADTADVRVRVAYHRDEAFKRARVCEMERPGEEYGLGIFTHPINHHLPHAPRAHLPPHAFPKEQLRFDVTLTLPAGNEGPLSVKKLETKLPSYSQSIADLQKSVLFDEIVLGSVNGQLGVQSVAFKSGKFSSLNGEIDGHFNAHSSLDLHTVNGAITSTVNLLHHENEEAPELTLRATNGQIDAQVSLTSEASVGGKFKVNAKSVNGDIGVKFTDTPVDSVLFGRVETTVGKVEVELDSAFEGTYSLQSMLGKKVVSQREVEDPSGKGRERVVTRNEKLGRVDGEVKWVEKDGSSSENEGNVVLKALVSSLSLVV